MDNTTTLLNHLKRQSLTLLPLQHLRIEASFFGELELVRLPSWTSSLTTLGLVDVEDAFSSLIKVCVTFCCEESSDTDICMRSSL
jgi:hypothetical protein